VRIASGRWFTYPGAARVETCTEQQRTLAGADFAVVCFQIGDCEPRTAPYRWKLCEDIIEVRPQVIGQQ
jgi:alpha-galactosidase/6-phospho-beta-glucosidase family protein